MANTTESTREAGNVPAAEPAKAKLVLLGDRRKVMGEGHGLSRQYVFDPGSTYEVSGRDAIVLERSGLFALAGTPDANEAQALVAQRGTQ